MMNNVWRFKMKMVKSLLLGSATGLVAIAGAQAADLPVKAKPVQYVKICSLYGAGFYYIPGTDTCLKLGGFVRAEVNVNTPGGSFPQFSTTNFDTRAFHDDRWRTRGGITVDTREQTAYGTLRSYLNMTVTVTDASGGTGPSQGANTPASAGGPVLWANAAFIQFAGFTAGNTVSFFDFDPIASYSNQTNRLGSATGGTGIPVFAYTAQFGNGFSASISAESTLGRRARIAEGSAVGGPGAATNMYAGFGWPDVVGNLHIDQSWGSAQVMGAIHQVNALYYSSAAAGTGGPGDEVGYALGAGLKLNLPALGKGDFFITQFNWSKGAIGYAFMGGAGIGGGNPIGLYNIQNGTGAAGDPVTLAYGPLFDATYSGAVGSSLNLTEAWSFTAGLQHNWMPGWKTSLYGGYAAFNYGATSDAILRFGPGATGGAAAPGAPLAGSADWSMWEIGSRTVWSPVKNLDISVEVMYNSVSTAYAGASTNTAVYEDKDWWSGIFRVQRNFYP
jgi:Porin subfamily